MIETAAPTDAFEQYRPLLFSIAYRMVGSVTEAEDLVQETYIRWHRMTGEGTEETIHSPKAWLSTTVTRLAIDHLKSARVRREQYVGPWLPEPLETAGADDAAGHAELAESLSLAFLVLLESLTPVERAVFLLHDVFDYSYAEIAEIVGKSEANCRQLARRARGQITERRPRFPAGPEQRERLLQQFLRASTEGDLPGLVQILAEDVTVWADGGGKAFAAKKPVIGREKVAKFFINTVRMALDDSISARMTYVNGQPALIASQDGKVISAWVFDMAEDQIRTVWSIVNPDKLALHSSMGDIH
jgi:RNA polymerase sigma-70 factor (ECF subfamily)